MHERWNIIDNIKNYKNFIFCIYNFEKKELIPEDYSALGEKANQKLLNFWTMSEIIRFKKKIKFVEKKINNITNYQKSRKRSYIIKDFKEKIYSFYFSILSKFFRTKIHFKNIGIPKYKSILLNLKLRQFPIFWIEPKYKKEKIELNKRKNFFYKKSSKKNFYNFIEEITYLFIPKSYLEDYKNIKTSINKSYWPKNVQAILSAYDFTSRDLFKIWSAEMVLKNNAKYIILQHGGNSGLGESAPGTDLHSLIADKYLTWGWKGKFKNNIPFHSIGLSNHSLNIKKKAKKIYFCFTLRGSYSFRYESLPRSNVEKIKKDNSIFKIINNINSAYTKDIVLRYREKTAIRNFTKINKNKICKKISFDKGNVPFLKILSKVKIAIHDTNNTGFLECLFYNVPTILILDKNLEKFDKRAVKYFKLMEKNKIIHYDPKSVTNFINQNFNTIDEWWYEKKLQKIRKEFCNVYVKNSQNSIDDLSKLLKKITS